MTKDKISLVLSDLDGTLLSKDRSISKEAIQKIKDLQSKGICVSFATGRPPYAITDFRHITGVDAPVICCNGAIIEYQGRVMKEVSFDVDDWEETLTLAAKMGMTVLIYQSGVEYTLRETSWVKERELRGKHFPIWNWEKTGKMVQKVNIIAGEKTEEFQQLLPRIKKQKFRYSISIYASTGCEVVALGVDKADAMQSLCKILQIHPKEVLAIGDSQNDIALLRAAGIGAAVQNAEEEVKRYADYVCKQGYTEGVLEAMAHFLEERENE